MEPQFWCTRWSENQIGWHESTYNQNLLQHWQRLTQGQTGAVFVPLCGKSLDLVWLAEQGHRVFGVEVSDVAVDAFVQEQGLRPTFTERDGLRVMQADPYTIYVGNFFDLCAEHLSTVDFWYDRAAYIALPPPKRALYAAHMSKICPGSMRALLVGLNYDQNKRSGPPFAVSESEVSNAFGEHFEVDLLVANDILADSPKFQDAGLDWLVESAYLLGSKAA